MKPKQFSADFYSILIWHATPTALCVCVYTNSSVCVCVWYEVETCSMMCGAVWHSELTEKRLPDLIWLKNTGYFWVDVMQDVKCWTLLMKCSDVGSLSIIISVLVYVSILMKHWVIFPQPYLQTCVICFELFHTFILLLLFYLCVHASYLLTKLM